MYETGAERRAREAGELADEEYEIGERFGLTPIQRIADVEAQITRGVPSFDAARGYEGVCWACHGASDPGYRVGMAPACRRHYHVALEAQKAREAR